MSYIINRTDGTVLTEIIDGTVDQSATDLTLVGKNATTYGEFLNENFIKILENFSNTTAPSNPISGQLWFDTLEKRLKVYDGTTFKVSGGTVVSKEIPASIAAGDIWIDSLNQQMFFNDGTGTYLAGPVYSSTQGKTGFIVEDIIDSNDQTHTVSKLYVANSLLGIFSKDQFTPRDTIEGFAGDIYVGFTIADNSSIKFRVPVAQADYLLGADGNPKSAANFISINDDTISQGRLTIQNSTPLVLGPNQNIGFSFDATKASVFSQKYNQDFQIQVLNTVSGPLAALHIDAELGNMGIFNESPQAALHIGTPGDTNAHVIIEGNLTVNGTQTTVNSSTLIVEDKNIILSNNNLSDTLADGGGITLMGETNKTINWSLFSEAWTSSEHFNLVTGKEFKINNQSVLSFTSLGTTVTSALGLTKIGSLSGLQVGKLQLGLKPADDTGTLYEIKYNDTQGIDVSGSIKLTPLGTGTVDLSSKRITSLAVAEVPNDTDAANVLFVRTTVRSAPIGFALETAQPGNTELSSSQIAFIVADVYPPTNYEAGTVCRVHCRNSNNNTRTVKIYQQSNGAWQYQEDVPSLVV